MNSANRTSKPRRLTQGELVAIALFFVGVRIVAHHLYEALLNHVSH